jgi:hypothetical protein
LLAAAIMGPTREYSDRVYDLCSGAIEMNIRICRDPRS